MENNQTLGKVVFHLWLSSLVPYILFFLLTNLIYEGPVIGGEYFFLLIGPSIYMYFFKKKYSKHFSLGFSRRVATYFTISFLLFYFFIFFEKLETSFPLFLLEEYSCLFHYWHPYQWGC